MVNGTCRMHVSVADSTQQVKFTINCKGVDMLFDSLHCKTYSSFNKHITNQWTESTTVWKYSKNRSNSKL